MGLRYFHLCTRITRAISVILYSIFAYPLRTGVGQMKAVRRLNTGVLATLTCALIATSVPVVVGSNASWRQGEWDHASLGTLSCSTDGTFATRAAGRLVGGSLLPVNLDTAVSVKGMTTTHDGTTPHPNPANATAVGSDSYVNPLDINALGLVDLPLTSTPLADFLHLPLGVGVGVVNQFARAKSIGTSLGASGVVNNSGSVMTNNDASGNPPTLGTLKLSTLVSNLTGTAIGDVISGVTDLDLEIGAVAGRAALDECANSWDSNIDANLERTYAIAGLKAKIDSPTVAALSGQLTSTVTSIQTLLSSLAGDAGVLAGVTSGVAGLLSGVLGTLSLGSVSMTGPIVTANLTTVSNLAQATIRDTNDTVSLNLGTGEVSVDLAALMGQAYGGQGFNGTQAHGLNGLSPNTQLLINSDVTNALVAALTQALDNWVTDVVTSVDSALSLARVQTTLTIALSGDILGNEIPVATVTIPIDASLQQLLAGTATITPTLLILGGPLGSLISALVNPLVSGIVGALTTGVGPMVGAVIQSALYADGSVVKTLGATLSAATAPVVTMLSTLLSGYLGVDGLVSLRANLQNDAAAGNNPDPSPALSYADWESGADKVPTNRYDVAALGVGVLNAIGVSGNVNLELGRASVGINCLLGGARDTAGVCAGY